MFSISSSRFSSFGVILRSSRTFPKFSDVMLIIKDVRLERFKGDRLCSKIGMRRVELLDLSNRRSRLAGFSCS